MRFLLAVLLLLSVLVLVSCGYGDDSDDGGAGGYGAWGVPTAISA